MRDTTEQIHHDRQPGHLQILLSGLSDTDDLRLEELKSSCKLEMHPRGVSGRGAIDIIITPEG